MHQSIPRLFSRPATLNYQRGTWEKQNLEVNCNQLRKKAKKITPKVRNIYQMFLRNMPATYVHVANVFNVGVVLLSLLALTKRQLALRTSRNPTAGLSSIYKASKKQK